ncbi:MAG: conjugal transfer protein TraR, partial [Ignavibacteria bacterium]
MAKRTTKKDSTEKKTAAKKTTAKSTSKKTVASKAKSSSTKTTKSRAARKVEVVSKPKPKKKAPKGYSKTELKEFKEIILKKREEILETLNNLKEQMMDTSTGQYV